MHLNDVSHEIRTPLTCLTGYLELLESDTLSSDQSSEFVSEAQRSAEQLIHILDSVLELMSLDADFWEHQPQSLWIHDEVQTVVEPYWRRASEKNIHFRIECSETLTAVMDRMMFRSIIRHLVDNAIKFTESGEVHLTLNVNQSKLSISITDTGVGISNESMPFIFKKHWQRCDGADQKPDGLGIGLYVLKHHTDAMKGSITIKSHRYGGTQIRVDIPITTA